MASSKDTITAIATPSGRGGIGVIRVSGDLCSSICQSMTGGLPEPRYANYVKFKAGDGRIIDNGIVLYFKSPASYTGEDVLEYQVHGSQMVLDMLQEEILTLGARMAMPGEFTERAFLNNKLDLLQAEAVADLIDSHSKKAARSALQSLSGIFSTQVSALNEHLFKARALIEAALDFPDEEDVVIDLIPARQIILDGLTMLDELLGKAEAGRVLDQSPSLVIVGPPNVGKSSILNFLSGHDSAIVSSEAGTTRDVIKEQIRLNDNVFTLIDTAGIRESEDDIEQQGIQRTYNTLATADIALFVFDVNQDHDVETERFQAHTSEDTKILTVWNKTDLCHDEHKNTNDNLYVSAKTGAGMDILVERICDTLSASVTEEDVVFARQRHIDLLESVKQVLQQTLTGMDENIPAELLAEQLRLAMNGLDEMLGKTTTDDILGEIFSRFCIGK